MLFRSRDGPGRGCGAGAEVGRDGGGDEEGEEGGKAGKGGEGDVCVGGLEGRTEERCEVVGVGDLRGRCEQARRLSSASVSTSVELRKLLSRAVSAVTF